MDKNPYSRANCKLNIYVMYIGYTVYCNHTAIFTLTWKVKCLKSLNICFFLFFSSSRNRVCVRASQAQFPVFQTFQFTIQISFQDGGHSMSDYFSLKQIIHLSTNFSAFFCGFWINPTLHFLGSWLVRFFSCNVSGNVISGSLSFSNFIRLINIRTHGM
jgi:hypothetical protein